MQSNLERKPRGRFSPDFQQLPAGYSQELLKYNSATQSFETNNDIYDDIKKAEERSYNLGCSGYRKVLVSANGVYKYSPCNSLEEYKSILKGMPKTDPDRKYYEFDPTDNVYDVMNSINDRNIKEGYNYKNSIFKKTLSNVIFRDPTKENMLNSMQRVLFGLIESVKQIKNHFNYTVPRNNKRVF